MLHVHVTCCAIVKLATDGELYIVPVLQVLLFFIWLRGRFWATGMFHVMSTLVIRDLKQTRTAKAMSGGKKKYFFLILMFY